MNRRFRRGIPHCPRKQPNALKHGVYTQVAILPGEDPRAFAALHSKVVEEWRPSGPTEEDAVLTIAKGMWRKARIQKFNHGKITARRLDGSHPACDRVQALRGVSGVLDIAPDCLDQVINRLPEDLRDRLTRQFPAHEFETDSARAQAMRDEINSVILRDEQRIEKPVEGSFLEASELLPPDEFKLEIELEERIDATIDRAVKRLIQLQALRRLGHKK